MVPAPIAGREPFGDDTAPRNTGDLAGLLTRDQRVADQVRARLPEDQRDLSFGKWLRGVGVGNWSGAERERRASMLVGSDTAGGYLVPESIGARIIDLIRAQSVVTRAGALSMEMGPGSVNIPKLTASAGATWHSELTNETTGALTFGSVRATPRTAVSLARCSVELLEDSEEMMLGALVESEMAKDLALAIDLAALKGSGAGAELLGLVNWAGVPTDNFANVTFDEVSEMASTLAAANFTPTAIVTHPTIEGRLARFKSGDGMYLDGSSLPSNLRNVPRFTTTQIASAGDLVIGDFSRLWMLYRTQIRFEVSREATVDSVSSFSSLAVAFRAYMRLDSVVTHPTAFVWNASITG